MVSLLATTVYPNCLTTPITIVYHIEQVCFGWLTRPLGTYLPLFTCVVRAYILRTQARSITVVVQDDHRRGHSTRRRRWALPRTQWRDTPVGTCLPLFTCVVRVDMLMPRRTQPWMVVQDDHRAGEPSGASALVRGVPHILWSSRTTTGRGIPTRRRRWALPLTQWRGVPAGPYLPLFTCVVRVDKLRTRRTQA